MKKMLATVLSCSAILSLVTPAFANCCETNGHTETNKKIEVKMELLDLEKGNQNIGKITITESEYGLVFTPELKGLTAGLHGFHIHQNPSCASKEKNGKLVAGLGAGGHWDPKNVGKHGQFWSDEAHLGDLPALSVNENGTAHNSVLVPRLTQLDEIKGLSLMIHKGGDNHSDHPAPLGGGGPRMACGIIE
ncbi:superoxide dismutase [Cu-Zn] SodC [Pasteurella atlantica]|uniref:Superoxide dismutase [Cu-Zn] n=2 Tax=Pasteurellales TaxID=135625 RepID=A0AAW8CKG0_9PAST|nr:superoxide dismutase family protein [Pasteurella atlantica]MBR0573471.1 superoxide dismutase family protein [Pasteurella atlantica]MDP8039472.1 superoxide dismutase [Cu-Zn] SodC [Pasteurella atlantica]MDP8041563.1 superoxide dismutase [Cu-Zn] SodC [Pasteurella atlantica]MDP8043700.1 superoxide dismutase [Cu-Zn] SodC [Pasteurella atlantica]MDP8045803.1 superoxide dismutase [Cu-Zn] SodC [Pasteurella atlantica]